MTDVTDRVDIADEWESDGLVVTPLYTAPQPDRSAVLEEAARKAHDTLIELNQYNYTHDAVVEANDATIEAILLLADVLGETHGKSPKWWAERRAALKEQP